MTPDERTVMQGHVAYWVEQAERGVAIVFGPVLDPAGPYGIGIYTVPDEATMQRLIDADPARDLLKCTVLPMAEAVIGRTCS